MTPRPFAEVHFEGGRATGVSEVQIHEAEFEHERAVVFVEHSSPSSKRFRSGAPVQIIWGQTPNRQRTFYGYVNHIEPTLKNGDRHSRVVCVAPTWVFKEGGFLTYRNLSAPTVVKKIAQEQRFDTRHIKPHTKPWPVLHQGGKSEWEFMVQCAQKIGWTLFARGLELHCLDRKVAISQSLTSATLLTPTARGGQIRELKSSVGAASPTGGDLRVRDAYGINPRSGNILARRNKAEVDRSLFWAPAMTPAFGTAVVDESFESLGEIESKLGAAESLNRMAMEATLEGDSNPRVHIGRTVYIRGVDEVDNGHWYVRSAVHTYRGLNDATMTLKLGRDTDRQYTAVMPVGVAPPTPRGARLVNRQWVLS